MKKYVKADLMLVLVTMCWGVAYYMIDICLLEMDTFSLNAFRFLGAFIIAAIVAFPKLRSVSRTTVKYSFFIGISLVFAYIGCTLGVKYTSLSNTGFLCALTVVFTPVLAFFVKKQKPEKKIAVVVAICLAGIALMTLNEQLKPAAGDFFSLLCAFAYAVDLLLTESAVSREDVDAFQIGVFQMGFAGIFMLALAFIFEEPSLPSSGVCWGAALFLTVFCTGLAFITQAIAQQYTTASHVGVVFTLEPVFAGVSAFLLAGEVLLPRAYLGAVLLFAGILVMEVDIKSLLKKKGSADERKNSAKCLDNQQEGP